jgi:hypothetical protein
MRSMRSMMGGFIFRNRGPSLKVHHRQRKVWPARPDNAFLGHMRALKHRFSYTSAGIVELVHDVAIDSLNVTVFHFLSVGGPILLSHMP